MKIKGILIAMSLCLLFGGCVPDDGGGAGQDTTGGSGNQSTPTEAYEALIAQLQQELLALQEEHLQESEEYQARIDELEALLAGQTGGSEEPEQPSQPDSSVFSYIEVDGGIEITSYLGHDTQVTVPAQIDGKPVLSIGEYAFRNSPAEQVIVSDGVQSIGWFAFYGSYKLSSAILPASVTQIGYGAFDLCSSKLRITCPPSSYAAQYAVSYGIEVIPTA